MVTAARVDLRAVLGKLGITITSETHDHFEALCPYHDDSTPSWRIRRSGQRFALWHCKACGEGGDLLDLVQHVRGYAVRASARDWLELHERVVDRQDLDAPTIELRVASDAPAFRLPVGVEESQSFEKWLSVPLAYAANRGLVAWQVARWGVTYAAEGKLSGRLVIPVRDRLGALCGYMARSWEPRARRRYLYPSEAEGADMDVMFGEQHWSRDSPVCVLTEGALKSLAVERVEWGKGAPAVAALGGSGIRPMHAHKLASSFRRVVVLTDADEAGERAGDELQGHLARHVELRRCRLGKGEDADSVHPDRLREALRACLA
jgi:DNA primase